MAHFDAMKSVQLTIDCTVSELKKCIRDRYKIGNAPVELLIIYSHSVLLDDQSTLKSYGINDNSTLFIALCEDVFRFNAFILDPYNNENESKSNILDIIFDGAEAAKTEYQQFTENQSKIKDILSSFSFKCTKMTDLDIFTYETSTDCIKMPCGHGIPAQSLYFYAQSEYESNHEVYIKCPHLLPPDKIQRCDQTWYYDNSTNFSRIGRIYIKTDNGIRIVIVI